MIDLLPFFKEIFGSSLFAELCWPCVGIGLLAFFFLELYSFIDRRCR